MSDEYRHDLERRWHDETWCAIAGSPECGCGCIPVAEEIARAMCDRIDELEVENRRMREALERIIDAWKYQDTDHMRDIARAALSQEIEGEHLLTRRAEVVDTRHRNARKS